MATSAATLHRSRRRHVSLAKRVTRPVVRAVKRKRAMRRQREAKAAAMWTTAQTRGVKVPRSYGGGRVVPWSASEEQMTLARRNLKAREQAHRNRLAGKPRPKCGTNAAYHAHIERGEPTDQRCRDAHAKYNRTHR